MRPKFFLISLIGHIIVVLSVVAASAVTFTKPKTITVATISTVTPQQISRLLEQSAPVMETPKKNIPQVQVKDEVMPKKVRRKKQVAKQDKTPATPSQKKKSSSSKSKGIQGVRTDAEVDNDYLVILRDTIFRNWKYPMNLKASVTTTVYFKIQKNGTVSLLKVETPSGNIRIDRSAFEAVKNSNPFPPLPEDFVKNELGVHFNFIYEHE